MKHSLYVKILLGYLVFGILGFITISTLSAHLTLKQVEKNRAQYLYDKVTTIASDCRKLYAGVSSTLDELSPRLQLTAGNLDADIWLIKKDGTIIFDSSGKHTDVQIEGFNPAGKGNRYYTIDNYYHLYDAKVLTVSAPITGNFNTYGYAVVHYPHSRLIPLRDQLLNTQYLSFGVIFLLSLLILLLLRRIVFLPLKKITMAANEYALGNLKYEINLHTEDEMGYLAATLNYMASELNNMEEYQKRFISNVSHDFRSPLTSIKGYLEAMIDGTIPPELYEKYMNIVISETDRLTRLTRSTLELQALQKRQTFLNITTFDINQVIKGTAETFEVICNQKKLVIELVFHEKSVFVQADMGKIQQVLYNLIDNAIKFSHANSSILVETYERHGKIFVSVKDFGIGIPRESQTKIWNRFYKTDSSRGKDKKGTGLGLAIVREIITAHNENIDVISTEGIGTEFIFTLPKGSG